MHDWTERIADLSDTKRAVLARRLRERGHATEPEGAPALVAYVAVRQERATALDPAALQAFLRDWLPDHMIPSAFVLLKALPRTPSGKVDRHALPPPEHAALGQTQPFEAPRTPDEQVLADIWAEVLEFNPVGIHDNFFEMGGHSLLAIRLIGRVHEQFETSLPMKVLFDAPTVAGMAEHIAAARLSAEDASAPTATNREEIEL